MSRTNLSQFMVDMRCGDATVEVTEKQLRKLKQTCDEWERVVKQLTKDKSDMGDRILTMGETIVRKNEEIMSLQFAQRGEIIDLEK
jgi:SMC interacting uncharacterized protein involved in chromosome segregation